MAINVLILAIMLFTVLPAIPITFLILFVAYCLKVKGKYLIGSGLAGIVATGFLQKSIVLDFAGQFGHILYTSINGIIRAEMLAGLKEYGTYTIGSWWLILCASIVVAGYFLKRVEKIKMREALGVKGLDSKISELDKARKKSGAAVTEKEGTLVGVNKSKKKVYCPDRAKHIAVFGTTGSGKTILLSNFIKRAIENQFGLLIVDGKGDTQNDSLLEITTLFCEQHKKKLHVINMNDPAKSAKYNPFVNADETFIKDMLMSMSDWSEEFYKLNAERYFQMLSKMLLLLDDGVITFQKIIDYTPIHMFEKLSKELEKNGKITKSENISNQSIIKASGKIAEEAVARFATIAESKIGSIFSDGGIDITTAIEQNTVILFILNPLKYRDTSYALGRLVVVDSKKAVSNFYGDKRRKFFIFDEFNVYASTELVDCINKSRSANVTCFPSVQGVSDLVNVSETFAEQIIENCNNYFVLRQNSHKNAEMLAEIIGTRESLKTTYKIGEDGETTGEGSLRPTREFVVHPDEIKSQKLGECVFLNKDTNILQRLNIHKPY